MARKKMEKEAKKTALKKLKGLVNDDMHSGMKEKMKGSHKMSIIAGSKEGLKRAIKEAPEVLSKADKIMEARGDDFKCGGKKHKDGGIKDESGVLTDEDKKRYKSSKYEMPEGVKDAHKKLMSKADKLKELRKKKRQ